MNTAYSEEANPWEAQVARSDVAARKLNLDEGLWKILREPSREIIVHIPVMGPWNHSPGSVCSTLSVAGQQKAVSVTAPTSPWMKHARLRVG